MSKKLFQIDVPRSRRFVVQVPWGGVYRGAGLIRGFPVIFVEAPRDAAHTERQFHSVGSGELLPAVNGALLVYVGAYSSGRGQYRWHLYEERKS